MRRPSLLLLLALSPLLLGCAQQPGVPPRPGPLPGPAPWVDGCGPVPYVNITATVVGTEELWAISFGGRVVYRTMLLCIAPDMAPELRERLDARTLRGSFHSGGVYPELRLQAPEGLWRLRADLPLNRSGNLTVDLRASPPSIRWEGDSLEVLRHERHAGPEALLPWLAEGHIPFGDHVRTFRFTVNSSWNRGLGAGVGIEDDPGLDGSEVALKLFAPGGALVGETRVGRGGAGDDLRLGGLEEGPWMVAVETRAGSAWGSSTSTAFRYSIAFNYA